MITAITNIVEKRQLKRDLFAFLGEIERNLEKFYVMDQRQFVIDGFYFDAWARVKDRDAVKKHEAIRVYARILQQFNQMFDDHREFEKWYGGDVARKTPENARKLHAMKNDLDQRLKDLDAVIIPAGQALERELLQMGLLSA